MSGKFQALIGCQNDACAAEVSYHLDMVRLFEGGPICQSCYENGENEVGDWHELPEISLEDLHA